MRYAFAAIVAPGGGYRLGVATEGQPGYVPANRAPGLPDQFREAQYGILPSWEAAEKAAKAINEWLGLTPKEAIFIVLSSMAGPRSAEPEDAAEVAVR